MIGYSTPLPWLIFVAILCHLAYGARHVSPAAAKVMSVLQRAAPHRETSAAFVLALAIGADVAIVLWLFFQFVYKR